MALSPKKEKKILADYVDLQSKSEVARIHGVSRTTVQNIVKRAGDLTNKLQEKNKEHQEVAYNHLEAKHKKRLSIMDRTLDAIDQKLDNLDQFTSYLDLVKGYGILHDKEFKSYEASQGRTGDQEIKIIIDMPGVK